MNWNYKDFLDVLIELINGRFGLFIYKGDKKDEDKND